MILVCHVILEDHVVKVLKSTIAIFSKAMLGHIRTYEVSKL